MEGAPTPTQSPISTSSATKNNQMLIIVAVVVIAIVGIVAFLVIQNNNNANNRQSDVEKLLENFINEDNKDIPDDFQFPNPSQYEGLEDQFDTSIYGNLSQEDIARFSAEFNTIVTAYSEGKMTTEQYLAAIQALYAQFGIKFEM